MSLSSEVKTLLSTVSNLYRGSMPSTPDNAVAFYRTGGRGRDLTGTFLEEPTFQIKVRNVDYDTGEALCDTIADLLHGHSSTKILMIEQLGDTQELGRDEKNRSSFTINFRCYFRR